MTPLMLSRRECWQYDTNITISPTNTGLDIAALEFGFNYDKGFRVALDNGSVTIPQILLENHGRLFVFAVNSSNDVIATGTLWVHRRPKPDDYISSGEYGDLYSTLSVAAQQWIQNEARNSLTPIIEDAEDAFDAYAAVVRDGLNELNQSLVESNAEEVASEIESYLSETNALIMGKVDGAFVEDGYLYLTSDGEVVAGPLGPFSGGGGGTGGGSTTSALMSLTNSTGWLSKTIADGTECVVSITWSSLENDIPTGNGILTVKVNNAIKLTRDIAQGTVSLDISTYLTPGVNKVQLIVADTYGTERKTNLTITVAALSISSTFDPSVTYSGAIVFPYTPVGSLTKNVKFFLDGVLLGTSETSVSGRQQSYTIPAQTHGAHSLEVYIVATIDSDEVESNHLYYEIICVAEGNNTPIITSNFHASTAEQYSSVVIPYYVYTPNALTSSVTLAVGGTQEAALTVDRTEQTWTYRAATAGSITLTLTSGATTKTISLTVTESDIDVEAETNDLALYLSSYGRANTEANPGTWEYGGISAQFSNFNFVSDGWQNDSDNISVLRVSGDARLTIPYKPFANDFRSTGKTIEIEFATSLVMDYDAVILSCMNGGRGIELTAQKATLSSEQSTISTQYKENEHVRISFVAEKRSENRLLYIYINGIMSGAVQYPQDDDFSQATPANITIGSNSCAIDIYAIRVYDNDLTRYQILNNWIADTQNMSDLLERYNHNSVYDEYGNIVIAKLPSDLPYMVISCPELPQYKGDKKTISGYYVNPEIPALSFTFTNAQADVQGTSSQYYARKNYKIKFKGGFTLPNGNSVSKYAMRVGAIPTSTFTFKADVASSEGANNVELVRLYDSACPYKTPAQVANSSVRQGIDGFPIVIFWDNGESISFVGKYNFNNDKGTPEVFGFTTGDESWEVSNNTSNRVLWKSADFSGDGWLNDFESRYPEDYTNPANLSTFATWIVSTDTTAATNDALPSTVTYDGVDYTNDTAEYRLAKFKAELGNYVEMDSAIFYYLFTELFLMVDSRAKNMFPSFIGGEASIE